MPHHPEQSSAGTYTPEFTSVSGFQDPTPQTLAITGGQVTAITFTYDANLPALESWSLANLGTAANTWPAAYTADPDGDGWFNIHEFAAASPNDRSDFLKVLIASRNATAFTVTLPGKVGRRYDLQRSTNPATAPWSSVVTGAPRSFRVSVPYARGSDGAIHAGSNPVTKPGSSPQQTRRRSFHRTAIIDRISRGHYTPITAPPHHEPLSPAVRYMSVRPTDDTRIQRDAR